MRPWLFFIGDLGVPAYWALLMIGFMAAFYLSWWMARRARIDGNRILDLNLIILLCGVLGARLMHVLVEEDPLKPGEPILFHYLQHPLEILNVTNGLAFYGGLLVAVPVAVWFIRRRDLGVGRVADIAGVCIPLGLVFGRLGCFLAGCCHGKPTDLPWGVVFTDPASLARPLNVPLHPTQLYSSAFALLLFVLMWAGYRRWKRFDGQVFLWFVALYSSGRFLIEFLRNDNRGMFFSRSVSASQVVALPLMAVALFLLFYLGRKARKRGNGRTPSEELA
jgi:phosphatidylglycerol:prolipoprotein diacylglycerol transferase